MKEYPGSSGLNNKSNDVTVHEIWRYLVPGLVQWFNYVIKKKKKVEFSKGPEREIVQTDCTKQISL